MQRTHPITLSLATGLLLLASVVHGQNQSCSEKLSEAEQFYRDGKFESIIDLSLCNCFGAYYEDKNWKGDRQELNKTSLIQIYPATMRSVIHEMIEADSLYPEQLGRFKEYWRGFPIPVHEFNLHKKTYFTFEERFRAFVLFGKLYHQLGALKLSEHFALQSVMMRPNDVIDDRETGFGRIYVDQKDKVRELSWGPIIGWLYTLPVSVVNNRPGDYDFKYQTDGKVVLGAHFDYYIKQYLAVNFNFWFHSNRIVYTQKNGPGINDFDFYHEEQQSWIKVPVLLKWSSANHLNILKKSEAFRAKVFFAGGMAFDFLRKSDATIVDLESGASLYNYEVTKSRHRLNYEAVAQLLVRLTVGQNYVNVGFTGSYNLHPVLNQSKVSNADNQLYNNYGIIENNYKIISGFWTVTYEIRLSRLKERFTRH